MVKKMKTLVLATTLALVSTGAFAGKAEKIQVCADKVQELSDRSVSVTDAEYKRNGLFNPHSEVHWPGIECHPRGLLGHAPRVYNLWIDGEQVLAGGYTKQEVEAVRKHLDIEMKELDAELQAVEDWIEQCRKDPECAKTL